MIKTELAPPQTKRRFRTPWAELDYLCAKIRHWLYVGSNPARARRFESRLERVLRKLDDADLAVLRQEGWALLHELRGEMAAAIKHRKREIELTERLYASVRESVAKGDYGEDTAAWVLNHRDQSALDERRAILRRLEQGAKLKSLRSFANGAPRSRALGERISRTKRPRLE